MKTFFNKLLKYKYLIIILLSAIVYSQSIFFDITHLDDNVILNQILTDKNNISDIFAAFTDSYGAFYRPLQTASFIIDYNISGGNVWSFHLTNLLLHCLISCMLVLIFIKLGIKELTAFLWGLIFAVHPLFAHSVIWFPARGDLFLTLFGLLSFIFFIKFVEKEDWRFLSFNLLFYALSLFSKETAIVLPVLFIFYFFYIKKNKFERNNKNLTIIFGWLVLSTLWFIIRSISVTEFPPDEVYGIIPFYRNLRIIPELLAKFIFPVNLSTAPTFSILFTILGLLVILCLIYIIIKSENKNISIFGGLWFLLLLVPVMFFHQNLGSDYIDYLYHRSYLPIIGIFLIINGTLPEKIKELNNKSYFFAFIGLLLIYSTITFIHSRNYKDGEKFWKNAIKNSPDRAWYRYHLAKVYRNQKNNLKAEKQFEKALQLSGKYPQFYDALAELKTETNKIDEAIDLMRKCVKIPTSTPQQFNNLVQLLNIRGYFDESILISKEGLQKYKQNYNLYRHLLIAYSNTNRYPEGEEYAKTMILNNFSLDLVYSYYINWAENYFLQNEIPLAIAKGEEAISLFPNNPIGYDLLGKYYFTGSKYSDAEKIWLQGISINPNYPEFYNNLYKYYINIKIDKSQALKYANLYISKGGKIPEAELQKIR